MRRECSERAGGQSGGCNGARRPHGRQEGAGVAERYPLRTRITPDQAERVDPAREALPQDVMRLASGTRASSDSDTCRASCQQSHRVGFRSRHWESINIEALLRGDPQLEPGLKTGPNRAKRLAGGATSVEPAAKTANERTIAQQCARHVAEGSAAAVDELLGTQSCGNGDGRGHGLIEFARRIRDAGPER